MAYIYFSELKIFKEILQIEENTPIDTLNYIKRLDFFLNSSIAYRILLTIPITVAFVKRSFSKLKLIKSYLRSTMSQERLNGLAILLLENVLLGKVEYKILYVILHPEKREEWILNKIVIFNFK